VAVARALINSPSVILADEPSGNLDSENKNELHKLFFRLRDTFNQTIIIVTHDRQFAAMSDRILQIKDGLIVMKLKKSYNGIPAGELKQFLDEKCIQYNNPSFIESDPISIPHRFTSDRDREIAGFLTSVIAWGRRDLI